MGKKRPCCDKKGLKKGPWSAEEDQLLVSYITKHGHGQWRSLPTLAGLHRCGKSCRLRWTNYLRPDIIRGPFTDEEEKLIIQLHGILGNKWSAIAARLPGRTDNEIKNLWNTSLRKRLACIGMDPLTHRPSLSCYGPRASTPGANVTARHMAQWESARLEAEARLSRESSTTPAPTSDPFLRLWHSEVGVAFRKIPKNCSLNNPDSISGTITVTTSDRKEMDADTTMAADAATGSACSSTVSYQLDDSSDSAFQLLMDCPFSNDMGFFAEHFIF